MLHAGQIFSRPRGFRPPDYGRAYWWIVSIHDLAAATAFGREFIQVEEVISSQTAGDVAIFRQWIVDPNNRELAFDWAPRRSERLFRNEAILRATIGGMGMLAFNPQSEQQKCSTNDATNVVPLKPKTRHWQNAMAMQRKSRLSCPP